MFPAELFEGRMDGRPLPGKVGLFLRQFGWEKSSCAFSMSASVERLWGVASEGRCFCFDFLAITFCAVDLFSGKVHNNIRGCQWQKKTALA